MILNQRKIKNIIFKITLLTSQKLKIMQCQIRELNINLNSNLMINNPEYYLNEISDNLGKINKGNSSIRTKNMLNLNESFLKNNKEKELQNKTSHEFDMETKFEAAEKNNEII